MVQIEPKVRELVRKAPGLCGIAEPLASRLGEMAALAYDADASGRVSVFDTLDGELQRSRIECAFSWKHIPGVDVAKAAYVQDLCALGADAYHKSRGEAVPSFDEDRAVLFELERAYSDVAIILTVEEASVMTYWAP